MPGDRPSWPSSDELQALTDHDAVPWGLVELDPRGTVLRYNRVESELSGVPPSQAVGLDFFREVAPCTDVPEFRGRFERGVARGVLDEELDFDFNFVMDPVRVEVALRGAKGRYWLLTQVVGRIERADRAVPAGAWARNLDRDLDLRAVDEEVCASEPIHLPGAIQPHGGLIVVAPDGTVTAVSEQIGRFLPHTPEDLVGMAAGGLPAALVTLVEQAREDPAAIPTVFRGRIDDGPLPLDLRVHRYRDRILCELVPADPDESPAQLLDGIAASTRAIQGATPEGVWQVTCRELAALTGFDRILGYPMDPDGNGTVVAEAGTGALESLLGLSFPGADIPPQARQLYVRAPLRTCPNVAYTPAPLVGSETEDALDLSFCQLRSVSPYHVQYQRNMGVGGSLSLSVVVQGKLAGLLIAHHRVPRRLGQHTQTVAAMIARALEAHLAEQQGRSLLRESRNQAQSYRDAIRELTAWTPGEVPSPELLETLRTGMRADHVTVLTEGRAWSTRGRSSAWPKEAWRALAERAAGAPWATHELSRDAPELAGEDACPGLLVLAPSTMLELGIIAERDPSPEPKVWGRTTDSLPGAIARWKESREGTAPSWGSFAEAFALALHHDLTSALGPLYEARVLLRRVIDDAPVAVLTLDAEHRVLEANPAADRIFDVAPLAGRPMASLVLEWTPSSPYVPERTITHDDGTHVPVQVHTVPVDFGAVARVVYLQDLRPLRALERRLAEVQRLEESATLAAGLAHDFNNVLAVMLTNARLLETSVHDEEGTELLAEVRSAAKSGQAIAQEMMAFSRAQQVSEAPKTCDLGDAVDSCTRLASKLAGSSITLRKQLTQQALPVAVAATQVQQIVLNLVTNARDSISGHGTITLRTRREPTFAVLQVTDSGSGIAEGELARIFQPFFTTKPRGVGTGLGLFVVAGIADAAGGRVEVASEVGAGTTFTVRLPLSTHVSLAPRPTPHPISNRPPPPGSRVLLVEDRPDLRRAVSRLLSRAGYDVIAASSGPEALECLDLDNPPHLVLTDFDMPGMTGRELITKIRAVTDIPCILMSGLALEERADDAPFLTKPVDTDELLQVIAAHVRPITVPPPSSGR